MSHIKNNRDIIDYDSIPDYWITIPFWWDLQKTICNMAVFTCGYDGLLQWNEYDTFHYILWLNRAKNGGCIPAYHNIIEPILLWNIENLPQNRRFKESLIEYYYGKKQWDIPDLIHPCPRAAYINRLILTRIKPVSVIDPFVGSGSTIQVCEEIGIPYLGFEIKPDYINDINKRMKKGIQDHKTRKIQTTLSMEV